jgi:hypothetical protein
MSLRKLWKQMNLPQLFRSGQSLNILLRRSDVMSLLSLLPPLVPIILLYGSGSRKVAFMSHLLSTVLETLHRAPLLAIISIT